MKYIELPCLLVKNKYLKFFLVRSFFLRVQKQFIFLVVIGTGEVYLDLNGNKEFLASNHSAITNSDTAESIIALK